MTSSGAPESEGDQAFDPHALEAKWSAYWDKAEPFTVPLEGDDRPRKYVLDQTFENVVTCSATDHQF